MSLLCGTNLDRDDQSGKVVLGPSTHANCLITLRHRNNDVNMSGVATIKWRTQGERVSLPSSRPEARQRTVAGWRQVCPGPQTSWAEQEIQLVDVRWRNLNIDEVVEARDGYGWISRTSAGWKK